MAVHRSVSRSTRRSCLMHDARVASGTSRDSSMRMSSFA